MLAPIFSSDVLPRGADPGCTMPRGMVMPPGKCVLPRFKELLTYDLCCIHVLHTFDVNTYLSSTRYESEKHLSTWVGNLRERQTERASEVVGSFSAMQMLIPHHISDIVAFTNMSACLHER